MNFYTCNLTNKVLLVASIRYSRSTHSFFLFFCRRTQDGGLAFGVALSAFTPSQLLGLGLGGSKRMLRCAMRLTGRLTGRRGQLSMCLPPSRLAGCGARSSVGGSAASARPRSVRGDDAGEVAR